jgi:D-serine dehydratase
MNQVVGFAPELPLTARDKGVPGGATPIALGEVAAQGWNILREDVPLPVALIKRAALHHNSGWMRQFLQSSGASIAPHGKTTMSPALFDLQLADGAWAVTISTPHQIQVARSFGYDRLFLANQLVGRSAISFVVEELRRNPHFEFFCLVDSLANVAALEKAASASGLARPMNVLVELGYPGGRTGCRSVEEALKVARAVKSAGGALSLAGVEGFEGLLRGVDNAATTVLVEQFLDNMVRLIEACASEGLFGEALVILSAGGSSYYDLVAAKLGAVKLDRPTLVLLRSGCYITHDSIMYQRSVAALRERNPALADAHGGLQPALEIWAYVQSRPEAEKAIVAFGKRDTSYDDLPLALSWFRPGSDMKTPALMPEGHVVQRLNDQHCHMSVPENSPLQVGDMVGFGISHPCLTFDKWRVLHLVDERYKVVSSLRTYF